jgi:pyrroloquinoline quinone biosynthesis protein D
MPLSGHLLKGLDMAEPLDELSKPRLVRKARLRYEEVRQTDLLLLPERVVKLNATGAAILRLCDGNRTVREIAKELETRYGQQNLAKDVLEFLQRVSGQGWIE